MKVTEKYILLLCCFVLTASYINAQSIKEQIEQQKQREQYEREQREKQLKEEARIKKAQLNLNDLLQLLQSKDADYVDNYLKERGWQLHSTNIKETNDYDNEIPANYKMATWLFDKNPDNNLAKGWFYFYQYPTYDNAIAYTIADETILDRLQSELTKNDYMRVYPTDIVERGLESVYRNDLYEVNFKKQLKKQYDRGADISYTFFIYNYKQIEEQKAETARLAREAAEREEKYNNSVQRAENAYSQKQYTVAKAAYAEAARLKPENAEMLSDKIADIDINIYCQNAEDYFKNKQYAEAKEEYGKALSITPNSKTDNIKSKIGEIDAFMLFLKERTYRQYDYKEINSYDYNAKNSYIEDEMRKSLLAGGQILPKTVANIVSEIDTSGITVSKFSSSIQNQNLNAVLERVNKNITLKPCFINGYSVNAKAGFNYAVEHNHTIITVEKNTKSIVSKNRDFGIYETNISKELNSAPFGIYTFDANKTVINGKEYNNNKLVKMNGTGGPSNALLSLLVPGLGDHRVTYGQKNGIGIAILAYGFIGAGIGCKIYSNNEYKKYHEATVQVEMDKYYESANSYNQTFYACIGIGAIAWLYDVVWVCVKGVKNKKEYNAWKQSHLGVYHEPNLQATGLSYTINF
jgi:hypothetical protein